MAKITLTDTAGGYGSAATINANNDLIEAAVDNQLSRDGTTPNSMNAVLDMNSNRVSNMADGVNQQDAITLAQAGVIAGVTNPLTQDSVAAVFLPQTALEAANGITPTELQWHPGNVMRYGAVADSAIGAGGTDNTTAFQNAIDSGHAVYVPEGHYSIESTLVITSGGSANGGKTFIGTSNSRMERFGAVDATPVVQITGNQNYFDFGGGIIACREVAGLTEGVVLVGVNPTETDNAHATTGDMNFNIIQNFKIIGRSSNTGWDKSVGFYVNAASRRRGIWKVGGNTCNVYYNTFRGITAQQFDFPIHVSSEASFNSFDAMTAKTWGRAALSCLGYGNSFTGFTAESATSQDTTERFTIRLGPKNDSFGPETGTDDSPTATIAITGISSAAAGVVTTGAVHGLTTADIVKLKDIVDNGPDGDLETALNEGHFQVTVLSTTTFSIPVDTSALSNVYASGGTMQTDFLPNTGSRVNYIQGMVENPTYSASTLNVRLVGAVAPVGVYDVIDITQTYGEHLINIQGTHPGGIGISGFTSAASIGNNLINTPSSQINRSVVIDYHDFQFRQLDDKSSSIYGSNECKVLSGRMANLAESTAYNVLTWDNIGATDAAGVLKLTFCGKEDTNSDVHGGEISWLLPVTAAAAGTAIKYKDFQANENDENVTWSITSAAGTDTDTGKFTLVLTTGSTAGTGNFYYTWKVELVSSQLEGTNLDWDGDITVTNGGV